MLDPKAFDSWEELFAAASPVITASVMRAIQPELSAPFYDSRAIDLPPGEVVQLFGYDAARVRFFAKATLGAGATAVQMGNRDMLAADLGFTLPTDTQHDFRTVEEVYVKAIGGSARVYLWAEYRKS